MASSGANAGEEASLRVAAPVPLKLSAPHPNPRMSGLPDLRI